MRGTRYLYGSVLVAGFAVMASEMAAPRLLAPTFGTSHLVWTHVIGTILSALALGAWLGGRLADRWPTLRAYGLALAASGVCLSLLPVVSPPVLAAASRAFFDQDVASVWLSLAACCLLIAPPIVLLGMIPPWAIRIVGPGQTHLGRIAGRLSAAGALGSILGTFAASWLLLPRLGTRIGLLSVAGLLIGTGLLAVLEGRRRLVVPVLVAAPMLIARAAPPQPGIVFEQESAYQNIRVRLEEDGSKHLLLDSEFGVHSMRPASGLRTGGVWDVLSALPSLVAKPGEPLRVLILGLAGGTVAWQIEAAYAAEHRVEIDGVELDPAVVSVGSRYFGLSELDTLRIHVGDARTVLSGLRGPYDLVVVDAYRSGSIPFHLATVEFFEACRSRLAPGGILALNVAAPNTAHALFAGLDATLAAVFPHVLRFPADAGPLFQNVVYVAAGRPIDAERRELPELLRSVALGSVLALASAPGDPTPEPWRDDRAPVEYATEIPLLEMLVGTVSP